MLGCRLGGFEDLPCRFGLGRRGLGLAAQAVETVAFGQPLRGRRRGIGGGGKAVPAPQVALGGDQPLAGPKLGLKVGAARRVDHADLGQTAGKRRRRIDIVRKRLCAGRQGRGRGERAESAPMNRRGFVGRHVEIVAKRCAECGLVAARDGHGVDDRRPLSVVRHAQDFLQRGDFGAQALRIAAGLVGACSGRGLGFALCS